LNRCSQDTQPWLAVRSRTVFATALFSDMSVDGLVDLDLSYTPPLSSPWDPVQIAAQHWATALGLVESVGVGDCYSQWQLTRDAQPPIGDMPFTQILLVPKKVTSLQFRSRVSACLSFFNLIPDNVRAIGWTQRLNRCVSQECASVHRGSFQASRASWKDTGHRRLHAVLICPHAHSSRG
jgi:hypothetical protein